MGDELERYQVNYNKLAQAYTEVYLYITYITVVNVYKRVSLHFLCLA